MSADPVVLHGLADRYRRDAQRFRELGQDPPAALLERVVFELEHEGATFQDEPLTVSEASAESGYSESHLYHLLQSGELVNVGQKGAPRIRRGDLPRKGTRLSSESNGDGQDLAGQILRGLGIGR